MNLKIMAFLMMFYVNLLAFQEFGYSYMEGNIKDEKIYANMIFLNGGYESDDMINGFTFAVTAPNETDKNYMLVKLYHKELLSIFRWRNNNLDIVPFYTFEVGMSNLYENEDSEHHIRDFGKSFLFGGSIGMDVIYDSFKVFFQYENIRYFPMKDHLNLYNVGVKINF